MAEGLARAIFGNSANIFSAGIQPKSAIHPIAIQVMQEIDIDISQQQPKPLEAINLSDMDIIITLCSEAACPNLSNKQRSYHWSVSDPFNPYLTESEQLENVRAIRDELKHRILKLKKHSR